MSKVAELLNKCNPDGVNFDEIGKYVISLPKEILKNEYILQQGEYPVINSGRDIQGFYNKYNNKGDVFTVASRGESAGYIQYSAVPFWAGGLCYPYRTIDNKIVITKFLYYYLKKTEKSIMTNLVMRGGIPAINKVDFEKYEIPLPHIKVQEEIVEILDSFTNLIDTLNEELSLRQKQFEYYREKLLTFDNEEPVKMNDIILNLRTGLNPRTHFKLNTEDADCFYITVRELGLFDIVVDDKTDKINSQAIGRINERSNIQQNDILFSGTGTIGRTALVKNEIYKWNVKEGVYVITPNIMKVNPRYFITAVPFRNHRS